MTVKLEDRNILNNLAECVKQSVIANFSTMIGSQPDIRNNGNNLIGEGVVGIISMVGEFTWLLMLALPQETAKAFALKFAGFEIDYESPEMGDVVGELNNILAGDIVARLSKDGIKVAMSLPTVLRGNNVEPMLPRGTPSIKMHFTCPEGEFLLRLAGRCNEGDDICHKPGE